MTRAWLPQRQRLPASASRTCCSLGRGVLASSARAVTTMPAVQYPHCAACSAMNAAWSGSGWSGVPRPSIVVTSRLPTLRAGVEHERTARPPTSTVHAPHWARPQPKCEPVRPRSFRSTYSRGTSGSSDSTSRVLPFTRSVSLAMLALVGERAEELHLGGALGQPFLLATLAV